jgi:hypothetical protein
MSEVEIFWPAALPPDAALDTEAVLCAAGIPTSCRLRPTRRGADTYALVMVAAPALHSFLRAVFEKLGSEAFVALRSCVQRLLGNGGPVPSPSAVVFVHAQTGSELVFTADLPEAAFRQAIALDPGDEPGRWVWHQQQGAWVRFENLRGAPSGNRGRGTEP